MKVLASKVSTHMMSLIHRNVDALCVDIDSDKTSTTLPPCKKLKIRAKLALGESSFLWKAKQIAYKQVNR